jgi:protease YdgD
LVRLTSSKWKLSVNNRFLILLWLMLTPLFPLSSWAAAPQDREKETLLFGHDDRQPIANDASPWSAVAQIETAEQNLCSGILIAPQWVVSAGHCFISANRRQQAALTVRLAGQSRKIQHPDRLLLPQELAAGLTADGDSFIITPTASRYDIALLHLPTPVQNITPIPLWSGDQHSLQVALSQQENQVSQGGYPQDSLDTLLVHFRCQIRKLNAEGILEHRCDTLPGDSGSPLLLPTRQGWRVIGIQSSAPDASDRWRADNLALAIPTVYSLLNHWMH